MYDNISEAAGRIVDQLSRRRFVGRMGKGGLALAGALGLEKLCGRAFAHQQPPCTQIKLPKIIVAKMQKPMVFIFCSQKGCGEETATNRLCDRQFSDTCMKGFCEEHTCQAKGFAVEHVHIRCHKANKNEEAELVAAGNPDAIRCKQLQDAGETASLCICEINGQGKDGGSISCECQCF